MPVSALVTPSNMLMVLPQSILGAAVEPFWQISSPQGSWHSPYCHYRYIATTSQREGILTTILPLQFFWNVLAAAGQPTWHVSPPTPLNCPGTITHAAIAVSPNATLTASVQTLEQPNRLHMISLKGNPTKLDHATGQQAVECQQVGMIETPAGDAVLECMFAPQSEGTSTIQLHCAPCVPSLLSLCKRYSQHFCGHRGRQAVCRQFFPNPKGLS